MRSYRSSKPTKSSQVCATGAGGLLEGVAPAPLAATAGSDWLGWSALCAGWGAAARGGVLVAGAVTLVSSVADSFLVCSSCPQPSASHAMLQVPTSTLGLERQRRVDLLFTAASEVMAE